MRWPSIEMIAQRSAALPEQDFFTADLVPPIVRQEQAWKDSLASLLEGFFVDEQTRVKGWKVAGPISQLVPHLTKWLPPCKFILLTRSLEGCLRSGKTAQMIDGAESAQQWAQLDRENRLAFQALVDSEVPTLSLNYEQAVQEPVRTTSLLEEFSGLTALEQSVWSRKMNSPLHAGYESPTPLSSAEQEILPQVA